MVRALEFTKLCTVLKENRGIMYLSGLPANSYMAVLDDILLPKNLLHLNVSVIVSNMYLNRQYYGYHFVFKFEFSNTILYCANTVQNNYKRRNIKRQL